MLEVYFRLCTMGRRSTPLQEDITISPPPLKNHATSPSRSRNSSGQQQAALGEPEWRASCSLCNPCWSTNTIRTPDTIFPILRGENLQLIILWQNTSYNLRLATVVTYLSPVRWGPSAGHTTPVSQQTSPQWSTPEERGRPTTPSNPRDFVGLYYVILIVMK